MPTTKSYLEKIVSSLSSSSEVGFRPMMGEYILYYRSKVVGGLYDDRLLVKPARAVDRFFLDAPFEIPYAGAKAMRRIDDTSDEGTLVSLFAAIYAELYEK